MGRIATLVLRIRDSLSDPSAKRWSNDRILRLIDEAQKDIALHANLLRSKTDIAVIADTSEYYLPAGAFNLTRVISADAASTTLAPSTDTGDADRAPIPIRSHAQMDLISPTWENEVGDGIKAIVFDKLNPRQFKIYPIPTTADNISSYTFTSDFGVLTDSTGDVVSAFGVTADVSTSATQETTFNSVYGVVTDMASLVSSLIVYYQRIPTTLDNYSLIDVDQVLEIDEIFDKAIKHYVVGMSLRDDKDTQNRVVGNEELKFYDRELKNATARSSRDFSSAPKQINTYNNGFSF